MGMNWVGSVQGGLGKGSNLEMHVLSAGGPSFRLHPSKPVRHAKPHGLHIFAVIQIVISSNGSIESISLSIAGWK